MFGNPLTRWTQQSLLLLIGQILEVINVSLNRPTLCCSTKVYGYHPHPNFTFYSEVFLVTKFFYQSVMDAFIFLLSYACNQFIVFFVTQMASQPGMQQSINELVRHFMFLSLGFFLSVFLYDCDYSSLYLDNQSWLWPKSSIHPYVRWYQINFVYGIGLSCRGLQSCRNLFVNMVRGRGNVGNSIMDILRQIASILTIVKIAPRR